MSNSFYSEEELSNLGLKKYGTNVLISKKASLYGCSNISLGSNVRIDDFCILRGNIQFGSNIHLAAYSALYGGESGITIGDFANISSRVVVYSISDDYSGESMTNPTIPDEYKKIHSEPVDIGRHVIIGSGSTILPGVILGEGVAIGAMSLVKESIEPWKICAGVPVKFIKYRSQKLLELECKYRSNE